MQDNDFEVQGLVENREYEFRVAACNENGPGEFLQAENSIVAKLPYGKYCKLFLTTKFFKFTN